MKALLATTYFGPVQWYQKLNRADMSYIECYDRYRKQTYRNRCVIATTNVCRHSPDQWNDPNADYIPH